MKKPSGKTRDIGGVKAPPYGSNPKVEASAKGKTVGIMKGDGRKNGGKC